MYININTCHSYQGKYKIKLPELAPALSISRGIELGIANCIKQEFLLAGRTFFILKSAVFYFNNDPFQYIYIRELHHIKL